MGQLQHRIADLNQQYYSPSYFSTTCICPKGYSPIAALNRTYALSKANGKAEAIIEAEKLDLPDNHFYFTLLGELYKGIDNKKAKQNLEKALAFAKTQTDKQTIQKKIDKL